MGTLCLVAGAFLYCGSHNNPTAQFLQPNTYPTEYMAQQMIQARQYRDARTTPQCKRNEVQYGTGCMVRR